MTTRATEAERTGDRIIDAMLERFRVTEYARIRLEDVAADASVTVQTVIRRFGSKAGLMGAMVTRELGVIMANRAAATGTSVVETITALAAHYEVYGRLILKTYAEASQADGLGELVDRGRAYHLDWCRNAFAGSVREDADAEERERRIAQIVAVCDARTWYILREDSGLSAEQTRLAILELLRPLVQH